MDDPSYTLTGPDAVLYLSTTKGTIGGHRRNTIFGRLDCPSALRAIARGGYITQRVFFIDTDTALRAGYRPCATCMADAHRQWKDQPTRRRRTPTQIDGVQPWETSAVFT